MPDEEEAAAFTHFVNRTRVPIRFAGMVTVLFKDESQPVRLAVVQLDAATRPDVADLARVFRAEGVRRITHAPPRYGIERGSECMIMTLAMTDPVHCEFSLVLPWNPYQELFELIQMQGFFYLTTAEVDQHLLWNSIRVRVPTEELAEILRRWRTGWSR